MILRYAIHRIVTVDRCAWLLYTMLSAGRRQRAPRRCHRRKCVMRVRALQRRKFIRSTPVGEGGGEFKCAAGRAGKREGVGLTVSSVKGGVTGCSLRNDTDRLS